MVLLLGAVAVLLLGAVAFVVADFENWRDTSPQTSILAAAAGGFNRLLLLPSKLSQLGYHLPSAVAARASKHEQSLDERREF